MKKFISSLLTLIILLSSSGCQSPTPLASPTAAPTPIPTTVQLLQQATITPTLPVPTQISAPEARSTTSGYTEHGTWQAESSFSPLTWQPGVEVRVKTTLTITQDHLNKLAEIAKGKVESFSLLVTADRTFDADGWMRSSSDERMSTLLTPTGLPIEGGIQGAVTKRFGYDWRTPVDELVTIPLTAAQKTPSGYAVEFSVKTRLPADLPPGIYRLRLDYGVTANKKLINLNCEGFSRRPFFKGQPTESHVYLQPVRASGTHASGKVIDASKIQPRMPWVILAEYNSNGYRGVIAQEDRSRFALSQRNLIHDEVVIPLYDEADKTKLAYNLEPQFPMDTIEARSNIPWDFTKGELSIQVIGPDGKTTDLGKASFVAKTNLGATTKKTTFTKWTPTSYGQYTVKATGWIADIWGNRYEGGGTYRFWVAKRMTLATATFQGVSYPVGGRYGRDIGFNPAVPADVTVSATLYVNSDPSQARTISYSGKASPSGVFGAAQGSKPLPLDAPGEYVAHILATYTDMDGHLWVCPMTHAGVVYPDDTPIVARGKKVSLKDGKLADRGDTQFEGWADKAADTSALAHINFPYQAGDVLLIASDGEGANKIEPVLNYETKVNPAPWDAKLQSIGISNLKLKTSNGYSPHLFPEYITDWQYYYAGAPRPGFMGRFLVAENGTRAPYWPTTSNSFGGQINASQNGDLPGDIYRLLGGVVVKDAGKTPLYAGYMSSAFILPEGSKNNRVISAGGEDLIGSNGKKARFYLVGTRPGMVYETGSSFTPAVQIDPILPAQITFTLTYPDGRQVTASGTGDSFGSWAGKDKWLLDIPGVYRYTLFGEWQGFRGEMPGLPAGGGEIFVIEKDAPKNIGGLKFDLKTQTSFDVTKGFLLSGRTTAQIVDFAAVIPGAVVLQGTVIPKDGKFEYFFNPSELNKRFPTYDIVNLANNKPELRDVVHMTFFTQEVSPDGKIYHAFARLIFRGNVIYYVR